MLKENQIIEMSWVRLTKDYYSSKGYKFTRYRDKFYVKLEDLDYGSGKLIVLICDQCSSEYTIAYNKYLKRTNSSTKDKCSSCRNRKNSNKEIVSKRIIKEFLERDLIIQEDFSYSNQKQKIPCLCLKHKEEGIQFISYGDFNHKKQGCKYCGRAKTEEARRLTIQQLIDRTKEKGFILLSEYSEYQNTSSILRFKCIRHGEFQASWSAFIGREHHCNDCAMEMVSGENHHSWNGGITDLRKACREHLIPWVKESFIHYNGRCYITGKTNNLDLHHFYNFKNILEETLMELNLDIYSKIYEYTQDELNLIHKTVLENHFKYGYGIPLRKDIHILFHKIYGYKNNSMSQLEEFKNDYLNGKYENTNNNKEEI